MPVNINRLEEAAVELNRRAAVATPLDARRAHQAAADRETNKLAKYVLNSIVDNSELAVVEERLEPVGCHSLARSVLRHSPHPPPNPSGQPYRSGRWSCG